jgi:hypothetical protein
MGDFTASTVPGCRAPHAWLEGGRSLYDAFGPGYTLIRVDAAVDVSALEAAARERGMPLNRIDVARRDLPDAYRHKLILVREDQHVAWRGNALPADPRELVALLCGAI